VLRHLYIIDALSESVCYPFLLAVQLSKDKISDRVLVILGVFPGYHRVVAVDLYRLVVIRDGEGEDLPVDFILPLDSTEELDNAPYRKGYAVGVLPVYNIERSSAALYLVGQEREVHIVRGYKEGLVPGNKVANE